MTLIGSGISVRFGGLQALDDVTIAVEPGSVVGIVGPNGAGKSTFFNCVTGAVTPDAGTVILDGLDVTGQSPDVRVRHGIGRSFQTPRMDLDASIVDVVALGFYSRYRQSPFSAFFRLPKVRSMERQMRRDSLDLMERVGITIPADTRASDVSLGHLRQLEVARALATGASYLLLDECAAGVDGEERDKLSVTIREAAASGIGVLLVEHDFGWLRTTSDILTVLVDGRTLASGNPDEISADPRVISAYLGEVLDD